MPEKPIVRGLYLCEQVIVEERTRNTSLINCFTRRLVDSFPSMPIRFVVYAVFANGQGNIPITIEFVDLETAATVYSRVIPVAFPDPLQEVRFIFRVVDLVIEQAGRFEVNLIIDGESVAQTRFHVLTP